MSFNIVAQAAGFNNAGVATLATSQSLDVQAGDRIIIAVGWITSGGNTITISDGGVGNTIVSNGTESAGAYHITCFEVEDALANAATVFTANCTSATINGIAVLQVRGLSASAASVWGGSYVNGPGTGANGITTGNLTPPSQPAALIGFCWDAQSSSGTPTAGTSPIAFTGESPVFYNNSALFEYTELTSTSAAAATFGGAAFQFDTTIAVGWVIPEPNDIAATASDASSSAGSLTTGVQLAAAASDVTDAAGVMGIYLYANAQDDTASSAALTTAILAAAAATDSDSMTGSLTSWASVVLAAPLYTGEGGILDPNGVWSNGAPTAGDTVYYDGTNMTIGTDGEIIATANAFSALVQWLPSAGVSSQMTVVVTPGLTAYAAGLSSASGALATGVALAAAAQAVSNAAAQMRTQIPLLGALQDVSMGLGTLATAIEAAANAIDVASASGALSGTTNYLTAAVADDTGAQGVLNTQIEMLGAAVSVAQAVGALATKILLGASALSISSAIGSLSSGIAVAGGGASATSAAGVLSTGINIAGAAATASNAAAQLLTEIQALASAADDDQALGALTTGLHFVASAGVIANAIASLSTLVQLAGGAQSGTAASGALSAQTRFAAQASDDDLAEGDLGTRTELAGNAAADSVLTAGATVGEKLAGNAQDGSSGSANLSTFLDPDANAVSESSATGALGVAGTLYFYADAVLYAPPEDEWPPEGLLPFGSRYQRVGEMLIYAIDWSRWLARRWMRRQPVVDGDVVRPTRHANAQYLCVAPGVTGSREPEWPEYLGSQVLDGGQVVWQCEALDDSSLVATITPPAVWSANAPVIALSNARIANEVVTLVTVDTTNALAGVDYDVSCQVATTDGRTKIGKFRLKVR